MKLPDWVTKRLSSESDETLKRWSENASALREIENTRGYVLIKSRLEQELSWARKELESASVYHFARIQAYIASLEVVLRFIRSTEANGRASDQLLSERAERGRRKTVEE